MYLVVTEPDVNLIIINLALGSSKLPKRVFIKFGKALISFVRR